MHPLITTSPILKFLEEGGKLRDGTWLKGELQVVKLDRDSGDIEFILWNGAKDAATFIRKKDAETCKEVFEKRLQTYEDVISLMFRYLKTISNVEQNVDTPETLATECLQRAEKLIV